MNPSMIGSGRAAMRRAQRDGGGYRDESVRELGFELRQPHLEPVGLTVVPASAKPLDAVPDLTDGQRAQVHVGVARARMPT